MVDLEGKDKGNISLPERLQPPNIEEDDYLFGEEHKVMIINMQKAIYEIKIADLEKRTKRLEDRNEFVHDECKATDFLIKFKDTETAKEIAELKRELSCETKKLEADNEEIEKIKQLRLQDKEQHEKNIKSMQERYEKTRSSLVSKMKILNAKINTLEDFKTVKEAFEQKLKESDQVMKENEEKVKSTLEQMDRKFKIAREKMKNDLYQRILNLASDFQIEISERLSLPIHRLIRENIVIQNEINQILNETSLLEDDKTREFEYSKEIHNEQIEENRKKTIRRIITCKIQACLVSDLKTSHSKMKKRLSGAKIYSEYSKNDQEVIFEELKKQDSKLDFRRRELEVNLHQMQMRVNSALNTKRQFKYTIKKLKQILYDVKFAASCALKIFQVNEEIEKMTYNQLLLHLLNKITENKSEDWIKPINSTETIFPIDVAYRIGDLGFDPPHSESEITSPKETQPSLLSGLEFLKEFKKRSSEIIIEPVRSIKSLRSFEDSKVTTSDEEEKEEIEILEETKEAFSENEIETDIEKENQEF